MIRCKLTGCELDEHCPSSWCWRCGEDMWTGRFIAYDHSLIGAIRRPLRWVAFVISQLKPSYCWGCNKRLYPWSAKSHRDFCCSECFKGWMPF